MPICISQKCLRHLVSAKVDNKILSCKKVFYFFSSTSAGFGSFLAKATML